MNAQLEKEDSSYLARGTYSTISRGLWTKNHFSTGMILQALHKPRAHDKWESEKDFFAGAPITNPIRKEQDLISIIPSL